MAMSFTTSGGWGGVLESPFQQAQRGSQQWNYNMGSGGGARNGGVSSTGAGSFGNLSARGIFDLQRQSNDWARNQNQQNYNEAKNFMLGIMPGYDADPMNQGARGLAAGLMADPEALNDQTQQKIINRAKAAVDSQMNAALAQGRDLLSSSGQMSTGNMQALQDRVAKQRIAALTEQMTGLDVQRANQRNADIMNATQLGSGLAGQRANLNLGVGQAWQLPQVLPDNYAGLAALLGNGGNRTPVGGGGGFGLGLGNMSSILAGQGNGLIGFSPYNSGQTGGFSPGQTGVIAPTYQGFGDGYGIPQTGQMGYGDTGMSLNLPDWAGRVFGYA